MGLYGHLPSLVRATLAYFAISLYSPLGGPNTRQVGAADRLSGQSIRNPASHSLDSDSPLLFTYVALLVKEVKFHSAVSISGCAEHVCYLDAADQIWPGVSA